MGKALILLAEDNHDTCSLYYWWLTEEGFDVIAAEDGEAALKLLETARPDLALTDLNMPGVDGFELIRRIKGRADLAGVPVVAMTSHHGVGLGVARELGAAEVIDKVKELDPLTDVLRRLLREAA